MLTALKRFFINHWVLRLLCLLVFALFIWFIGPLFAFAGYPPLGPITHRVVVIVIATIIVLLPPLFRVIRDNIATQKLIRAIKNEAKPDPDTLKSNPAIVQLIDEFDKSVKALKRRPGQKNLYTMPWYLLIGPPGTGKTTIVDKSGLSDDEHQHRKVSGIGGTRNCDWWFTQKAVMIDTAGRYFSQSSDENLDKEEWWKFLHLLKRNRPLRPINGALVTFSLNELVNSSREKRAQYALTIKHRLLELHQHLGIQVPIYFILTKTDTLEGFNEFFAEMGKEDREQVWGFTLPETNSDSISATLSQEFALLLKRLNEQMVALIHRKHDDSLERRKRIIGFPKQLALHQGAAISLLKELFNDQEVVNATTLRGVYLTSGTQDGTVLSRLVASGNTIISSRQDPLWGAKPASDKSYFLHKLFTEVIFPEAGLVGNNPRLERWLNWGRRVAFSTTALLTIALGSALVYNYLDNQQLLARSQQAITALDSAFTQVKQDYLSIHSIPLSLRTQLLNQVEELSQLKGIYDVQNSASFWSQLRHTGLNQSPALQEQGQSLYASLSSLLLLPAITDYLSTTLQGPRNQPYQGDRLYSALKHYILLTRPDLYEGETMIAGLKKLGWPDTLGSVLNIEALTDITRHLERFFRGYDPHRSELVLTAEMVTDTRRHLLRQPEDEAVFETVKAHLQDSETLTDLPPFSLYQAAGGIGSEGLLQRKSRGELREGIDALFTLAGFQVFDREVEALAEQHHRERKWVLNMDPSQVVDTPSLTQAVTQVYFDEYLQHYTRLVNDLELTRFINANQAHGALDSLINSDNPRLIKLIRNLCAQTQLGDNLGQRLAKGLSRVTQGNNPLLTIPCNTQQGAWDTASNPVKDTFRPLQSLVEGNDVNAWPINNAIDLFRKLQGFLREVAVEFASNGALQPALITQGEGLIQDLQSEAHRYPQPIKNLLLSAISQTSTITQSGIIDLLNRAWQAEGASTCLNSIANRFPFVRRSIDQVNLDDFAEYFGYGGGLETFFNEQLAQYIDVSAKPWQNKPSASNAQLLSEESLLFFQQTNDIKRAFFKKGANEPTLRFTLTPGTLHQNAKQSTLTLDGQAIKYQHERPRPNSLKWPGPSARKEARLDIELFDGRTVSLVETGDWAWFKLLQRGTLRRIGNRETYRLRFDLEGHSMEYTLSASSAFNPFQFNLASLRCPQEL